MTDIAWPLLSSLAAFVAVRESTSTTALNWPKSSSNSGRCAPQLSLPHFWNLRTACSLAVPNALLMCVVSVTSRPIYPRFPGTAFMTVSSQSCTPQSVFYDNDQHFLPLCSLFQVDYTLRDQLLTLTEQVVGKKAKPPGQKVLPRALPLLSSRLLPHSALR